jgi:hypothetical protein
MDELKAAIREVLEERARMSPDEHFTHHEWIRQQVAKDKARAEFWQRLVDRSAPVVIWGALSASALWAWEWLVTHITWK